MAFYVAVRGLLWFGGLFGCFGGLLLILADGARDRPEVEGKSLFWRNQDVFFGRYVGRPMLWLAVPCLVLGLLGLLIEQFL